MAELLNRICAVDARGFVQLLGDRLQGGDKDDHRVAEVLPDRQQDDRRHRPMRVAEKINRGNVKELEAAVEQAEFRMVEVLPHNSDCDDGRHNRREVDRAEQRLPSRRLRIHEPRHRQRNDHGQRTAHRGEVQRIAEGFPEKRIAEEL